MTGQVISSECAAKMHDMPLAVPCTGGGQCWSLLHRVVFFVDPVAVDLDGVDQEDHHFGEDEGHTEPSPIPPGVEFCSNHGPLVDASQLPDGALREKIPDTSMLILNCSLLSSSSASTISVVMQPPTTKNLFGPAGGNAFELDPDLWPAEERITE
jgi:hypothetical protein